MARIQASRLKGSEMTNIQFMCVADAIRATGGKFEEVLEESVSLAVSHMSAESLREAFFSHEERASLIKQEMQRKAA